MFIRYATLSDIINLIVIGFSVWLVKSISFISIWFNCVHKDASTISLPLLGAYIFITLDVVFII